VILGRINQSNATTVLSTTGGVPALSLRVKPGTPPLEVNSSAIVPRLNAQKLGGHPAKDFALAGSSYSRAQSDAKYALAGSSYSRAQSDAKYAPANGSPNYLARSTPHVVAAAYNQAGVFSLFDQQPQLFAQNVVAPAGGVLSVWIGARCSHAFDYSAALHLTVGGSATSYEIPSGASDASCVLVETIPVTAGQSVAIESHLTNDYDDGQHVRVDHAVLSVMFIPQ
jgi:hypothetical protein